MPATLPPALIAALAARLGHASGGPKKIVAPDQLAALFDREIPGASAHLQAIASQMQAWGRALPAMHVMRSADGGLAASSEDPAALPRPPAGEADFASLEAKLGRAIPQDIRQLYALANGGFGPGLYPLERAALEYDDLCRRGPDYTGALAWPRQLLPLAEAMGPIAYDLDRGAIVGFDDAFADLHPSLEAWLKDWLDSQA